VSANQVIFKYADQVFVGIATRKADGTLNHQGFVLVNGVPKKGSTLFEREVVEVLTEEELLKDLARRGTVDKMEAVLCWARKISPVPFPCR
jgi:Tfp pilus assembly ATPase PilU